MMPKAPRLYNPQPLPADWSDWDALDAALTRNWEDLQACDAEAKAAGRLIGRYLRFSVADGAAFYQIVGETAKKVKLRYCPDVAGDNYRMATLDDEDELSRTKAQFMIAGRDHLAELFSRKAGS